MRLFACLFVCCVFVCLRARVLDRACVCVLVRSLVCLTLFYLVLFVFFVAFCLFLVHSFRHSTVQCDLVWFLLV